MTEHSRAGVQLPIAAWEPRAWPRIASGWLKRRKVARWELAVAGAAVAGAVVAIWVTLRADFLAYPGWLAVQKADVILGPVGVGLYWRRRRPASRFGPMLIAFGLVGVPYIAQSAATPWLFGTGVLWEGAIYLATLALILAFPTGRLEGRVERLILALGALAVVVPYTAVVLMSPQIAAESSISGCRTACPANGLFIASDPSLAQRLLDVGRVATIAIAIATAGLLVWRLVTGTPPRRRALAIGTPVALVFLLMQASYQTTKLLSADATHVHTFVQWPFVGARAAIWYGFLLALIAAELFAGRVLRRIVEESLRRPSLRELEAMLRGPLGDPALRLAFWRPGAQSWADTDGATLEPPGPPSDRVLTEVERDGRPRAAILHDAQLTEDPELLQAAGAVALLALENAELHAAWSDSVRELRHSRSRIAAASDAERRKLERDLHDGAQQRLVAILVKLGTTGELIADDPSLRRRLSDLEVELQEAIDELRELAHGIYPTLLAQMGLVPALRAVALRSGGRVTVTGGDLGRYPTEVESAIYYCCLEAVQNATKHAGPSARISVGLHDDDEELRLDVSDDGSGFDMTAVRDGLGLRNMRDRLVACDGRLEITSAPGGGTAVSGAVPRRSRVQVDA